jgi:Inner membrane complex protein
VPQTIIQEKIVEVPVEKIVERIVEVPVEKIIEKVVEKPVEVIKPDPATAELADEVQRLLAELAAKDKLLQYTPTKENIMRHLEAQVDNLNPFNERGSATFGTAWPINPVKGDLFLKVDTKPNKLFKWNGRKWIEIDRHRVNDSLVYDVSYIDYVIDQVRRGHREYEDLSDIERAQIMERIKQRGNDAS